MGEEEEDEGGGEGGGGGGGRGGVLVSHKRKKMGTSCSIGVPCKLVAKRLLSVYLLWEEPTYFIYVHTLNE